MRPKVEQDPPKTRQAFLERCRTHLTYNLLSRIDTGKAEDTLNGRIPRVIANYLGASGLPEAQLGENLAVDGLVKTAEVYARTAAKVCGIAS